MQTNPSNNHPIIQVKRRAAFTLMETVIAIGVLAVLLTGFLAVFTPATQGIRRSINSQQADRLTSTLEREMVIARTGQKAFGTGTAYTSGFDKAFGWIRNANNPTSAIFVYQYRGNLAVSPRDDGTLVPLAIRSGQPGKDYSIQSVARRIDETYFAEDLKAVEGPIFYVKPTQLVYSSNSMVLGTKGTINNPTPLPVRVPPYPQQPSTSNDYSEAVLAFSAEFYGIPTKSLTYLNSDSFKKTGTGRFYTATKPVFTRNLAVRR